ncbi:nickel-dependent lactate racemase [bacterium]|nr:nickel-dependent lactate racemase [bacterium]
MISQTLTVSLAYGEREISVELPANRVTAILTSKEVPAITDVEDKVREMLDKPIASPPLRELAKGKKTACVVISDITRPVPNKVILPPLLHYLEDAGIKRENILILIATGLHRPNLGEELERMVGKEVVDNYRIENHNARDKSQQKYIGTTQRGTEIWINKLYLESDLKILTGLIEPHFMAGYSGGRKSICPGIAGVDTVKIQHGPHFLEHPNADNGIVEGNPFHEEALEIAKKVGVDFILNVTINKRRQVTGIFAGQLEKAWEEGVRFVESYVKVGIDAPVDIVLTHGGGAPLDATFYQTVKGMVGALPILKPGGSIVIVSSCSEGVGSEEFRTLLWQSESLEKTVQRMYDPANFIIDQWEVEMLAKVYKKAKDVYLYTDGLTPEEIEHCFVKSTKNIEKTINELLEAYGKDAKIAVISEGPYIIPYIKYE